MKCVVVNKFKDYLYIHLMECPCIENVYIQEKDFFEKANKEFNYEGVFYDSQLKSFLSGKKTYPVQPIYTYRNVFGVEKAIPCRCIDMSNWRETLPRETLDEINSTIKYHTRVWNKQTCLCGRRLIKSLGEDEIYIKLVKNPNYHVVRKIGGLFGYDCICNGITHDDENSDEETTEDESDEDSEFGEDIR